MNGADKSHNSPRHEDDDDECEQETDVVLPEPQVASSGSGGRAGPSSGRGRTRSSGRGRTRPSSGRELWTWSATACWLIVTNYNCMNFLKELHFNSYRLVHFVLFTLFECPFSQTAKHENG